jgi:hypothetical protein
VLPRRTVGEHVIFRNDDIHYYLNRRHIGGLEADRVRLMLSNDRHVFVLAKIIQMRACNIIAGVSTQICFRASSVVVFIFGSRYGSPAMEKHVSWATRLSGHYASAFHVSAFLMSWDACSASSCVL